MDKTDTTKRSEDAQLLDKLVVSRLYTHVKLIEEITRDQGIDMDNIRSLAALYEVISYLTVSEENPLTKE